MSHKLSFPEEDAVIQIENSSIKRSKLKKLLGIHIVCELNIHIT